MMLWIAKADLKKTRDFTHFKKKNVLKFLIYLFDFVSIAKEEAYYGTYYEADVRMSDSDKL